MRSKLSSPCGSTITPQPKFSDLMSTNATSLGRKTGVHPRRKASVDTPFTAEKGAILYTEYVEGIHRAVGKEFRLRGTE